MRKTFYEKQKSDAVNKKTVISKCLSEKKQEKVAGEGRE